MSTKFVSKNSNYMVVLKPGIEGNRTLGTHAISGLYVKFQSGIVDVKEESIITLLREHPSFGTDFVEVKQDEVDPFEDTRVDIEPMHTMSEIKYGHSEGKKVIGSAKMTPQLKKMIEAEAVKMIPGLLKSNPGILKGIIMEMAADMKKTEENQVREASAYVKEDEKEVEQPVEPTKKKSK
jgi:hypothetical protein